MIRQHARRWIMVLLLWVFLIQALAAANAASITVDEGLHIASGYTIFCTGDYRLIEEHPPLVKLWLALPLLPVTDLADPTTLPAWADAAAVTTESLPLLQMAQQLLYPYRPVSRWLFPARAMGALLGVLLLAVIYRWVGTVAGSGGALIAALLAACDPNLVAHSAVASTDVGAALLIVLSLWAATRFLIAPSWRRAGLTGLLLGLALAAKLTALLLGPALALAGGLHLLARREVRGRLPGPAVAVVVLAALVLWAGYAFDIGPVPGSDLTVPAPAHATPIMRLLSHSTGGHQAYLLGENNDFGWWYYFPVAFFVKTPVPALLLLLVGLVAAVRRAWRGDGGSMSARLPRLLRLLTPALLFTLAYGAASLLSPLNIGYRHLLPLLPLVYVAVGQGATWLWGPALPALPAVAGALRPQALRWVTARRLAVAALVAALAAWQIGGTLVHAPHLLGYFNPLVGGPDDGWRYLADSNTDWGQGYRALAAYQAAQDVGEVGLAAFVFYDPGLYGVDYTPLTPLGGNTPPIFPSRFAPAPGDYVISATSLDGLPTVDPAMYDWFRWRAPDAFIANALFHYRVTAAETATAWVAQCVTPTTPLDDDALAFGFGTLPARRLAFDCTQGWILPAELADANAPAAGAYVLHGALVEDTLRARLHLAAPPVRDPFAARHLAAAEIAYRQRMYRSAPAFVVYRAADAGAGPAATEVWAAQAEAPVADAVAAPPAQAPVALDGPLTFRGYRATADAEAVEVETWWQVSAAPDPGRPLSVMGHLLDEAGQVLGVADGLGVPPEVWVPGDILIQRHRFAVADADPEGLLLRTGVYTRDDGRRHPVAGGAGADVLLLPLDAATAP